MSDFKVTVSNKLKTTVPSIPKISKNNRDINKSLNNDFQITLQPNISSAPY